MSTEFTPKALAIINQMKLQRDQANDTVCEMAGLLAEEKIRYTEVVNDFAGLESRYESLEAAGESEKVKYANLQLNYQKLQKELNLVEYLYKESEHELEKLKSTLPSTPAKFMYESHKELEKSLLKQPTSEPYR